MNAPHRFDVEAAVQSARLAQAMDAPIQRDSNLYAPLRGRPQCRSNACGQGSRRCPTPAACLVSDEAADQPLSEPWDAWMLVELAAGAVVLLFLGIVAHFVWINWPTLVRLVG